MSRTRAACIALLATAVVLAICQPALSRCSPPPAHHPPPKGDCKATKTCIPTKAEYSAVTTVAPTVSFAPQPNRLNCTVPFALCAWANCSIIAHSSPPQAECGCVNGKDFAPWSVTVAGAIPSAKIQAEVLKACYPKGFNGSNICPQNKDPFCEAVANKTYLGGKWDTMSTFTPTTVETSVTCTGPGQVAVCDAAACYNKKAWDGSPITCYCTYYNVPAGMTYDIDGHVNNTAPTCTSPKGYVHSGIVPQAA